MLGFQWVNVIMSYQIKPKLVKPCSEEWNVKISAEWQGNVGKLETIS